jgi:hypothetical protein
MIEKLKAFVTAHWKALMPLVALAITSIVNQASDVDAPAGWKAAVLAALSSILVWLKRNQPTPVADRNAMGPDAGLAMIEVAVIIIALGLVLVAIKVY